MESHLEVLPKQDMGSELFFLRKKSSPFSILVKDLPYPEGQHRDHCPLAARAQSHRRAALCWLGRAGLSPRLVLQPQGRHSACSCSPAACIPSLLLGQACKEL